MAVGVHLLEQRNVLGRNELAFGAAHDQPLRVGGQLSLADDLGADTETNVGILPDVEFIRVARIGPTTVINQLAYIVDVLLRITHGWNDAIRDFGRHAQHLGSGACDQHRWHLVGSGIVPVQPKLLALPARLLSAQQCFERDDVLSEHRDACRSESGAPCRTVAGGDTDCDPTG